MRLWSNSGMKDYEQIITTLLTKIAELEKLVQQQTAWIAELEKRLNKNSSNSSKPPSTDELGKPPRTTSLSENKKRNSVSQTGNKDETLKQVASPDIVKNSPIMMLSVIYEWWNANKRYLGIFEPSMAQSNLPESEDLSALYVNRD